MLSSYYSGKEESHVERILIRLGSARIEIRSTVFVAGVISGGLPARPLWLDRQPGAFPPSGRCGRGDRVHAPGLVSLPALSGRLGSEYHE